MNKVSKRSEVKDRDAAGSNSPKRTFERISPPIITVKQTLPRSDSAKMRKHYGKLNLTQLELNNLSK